MIWGPQIEKTLFFIIIKISLHFQLSQIKDFVTVLELLSWTSCLKIDIFQETQECTDQ